MSRKNMIANRYEVVQHIGQGGMADVFRAIDTILNREVAIKILRSDLSTDAVSILRFEREAQAATALAHPNIVEVYDVGDYKGHHYIVMEYVRGRTLKQIIRSRGPLLVEESIDIMKQLTSAVAEAHSRGIIHRDLKPQNVIVKSDGSVKILDFGIATAKGSMQLTQANNVMGSVHYLAPELAKGETATPQSDIYALGIVLFEMLSGDVPFKADQAVQVALKQMREPMPDIRIINSEIPQSVVNVITRSTAKNPDQRYSSCDEMLLDLSTSLRPERANEAPVVLREVQKPAAPVKKPAATVRKAQPSHKVTEKQETPEKKPVKKSNRLITAITVILLGLLLGTAVYFGFLYARESAKIVVPDVRGMTVQEAIDLLAENDLELDTAQVTYILTENTEKGLILSVSPAEGTEMEKGDTVSITVSSGIGVKMKDYTGMKITAAEEKIAADENMNMVTVNVISEESDEAPGTIIRQEILTPDTLFNPQTASQLTLVYSTYPTVVIPDYIIGMPIGDAVRELENMGIVARSSLHDTQSLTDEERENLQYGVVIDVDPDVNTEYTQKEDNFVILYFY
ncbi:MAG: Stk1 family PASTA domain-containing Ser/Thr kinase [Solobacterium sp.]|nr:Stk1 family PASTA domain-containing Ser/Thr kinase [Solobacterium sp.]